MEPEKKNGASHESWLDFLSGNRLAIYSLIALAVLTLIGAILPQRGPGIDEARYQELLNTRDIWGLAARVGLLDIFRSAWFLGAFTVMCVNMIFCTVVKFRRVYKTRTPDNLVPDETLLQEMDKRATRQAVVLPDDLRRHFTWQKGNATEEATYYWAEQGGLHRYGAIITHAGVLVLAFGAVFGVFTGFNGMMNIGEGEQASEVITRSGDILELSFQVRCDDFTVEFYDDGKTPKTYRSDITFIARDGAESPAQNIEVNKPGRYGGFRFFQSNYGRIQTVGLRVTDTQSGEIAMQGKYRLGHTYRLPNDAGFFGIRSLDPNKFNSGPAADIVEGLRGHDVHDFWIFMDNPAFDKSRNGAFIYELTDVAEESYYTGLSVARNPGLYWVWTGSAFMALGIALAFFVAHKRTLIRLEPDRITVAGRHSRGQNELEQYLEALIDKITDDKGPADA